MSDNNRKVTDDEARKAEKMAEKFQGDYSEANVAKVGDKMAGYNKGPLVKVWDKVCALWELLKDPKAAVGAKAVAIGALLYMISPIDAIPDVLIPVGLLDDVGVITAAVATLTSTISKYLKKK